MVVTSLAQTDPSLAALCKEQNLKCCLPSPAHKVSKAVQVFLRGQAHDASQPEHGPRELFEMQVEKKMKLAQGSGDL